MDIAPRLAPGRLVVQGYGGGGFRVSGARHDGPILIFGDRVVPWRGAEAAGAAKLAGLEPVLSAAPPVELILFGLGSCPAPLAPALRRSLAQRGVRVEAMDTGAACRTFNVLAGEGRQVAAALLPVA